MTISANYPNLRPSLLLDFSNQTVLDPRVTFTRTTPAYYYDNHSAALGEQNLLLQSNTFTNAYWTAANGIGTPVVGATDPAGGSTGYTLTASAGSSIHGLYPTSGSSTTSIGSGTYTFSFYLQAGTNNYANISVYQATANWATATINLTSGSVAVSKTGSGATGTIAYSSSSVSQIGSTNWWRCSLVFTSTITSTVGFGVQLNSSATPTYGNYGFETWTSLGTETVLVYGAQLEQRSSPTVYTATTATAVNTYTPTLQVAPINSPRFDYNPVTRESLGLFLEQAATNVMLYSADYTNAAWSKSQCTITPSAAISPDGNQNASLMVLNTTSAAHFIVQTFTYTAATYTQSAYIKFYGQQFVQLLTNANGGPSFCNFDLVNGTAGTPSGGGSPVASIVSVGNGWYRCSLTLTAIASSAGFYVTAANSITASANPSFVGNGFNGYLIWGAQVELAPSATSYIANTSIANARNVDAASMTGTNFTSWYNYTGGTMYLEAASGSATGNPVTTAPYTIQISTDGGTTNQIVLANGALGIYTYVKVNNVLLQNTYVALPATIAANTFYKSAWYFSAAGNGISSAGQTPTTYAQAIVAPALNQLNIAGGNTNPLNGRIKKFAYYPIALTNTQIQSLSAN